MAQSCTSLIFHPEIVTARIAKIDPDPHQIGDLLGSSRGKPVFCTLKPTSDTMLIFDPDGVEKDRPISCYVRKSAEEYLAIRGPAVLVGLSECEGEVKMCSLSKEQISASPLTVQAVHMASGQVAATARDYGAKKPLPGSKEDCEVAR